MNFSKAVNVREAVIRMRTEDERWRSGNRARINQVFNGEPPLTETEAEENNANTNVNFLEAANIAHRARSTWNNAFLKPGNFFTVRLNCGPVYKRQSWGHIITKNINRPMKRSRRYVEVVRATGAQVVLHGIGPVWWPTPHGWCPEEIGIEDLLVPDSTKVNLSNLPHFAIYQQFTAGELFRMTHGEKVDPGWRMKTVNAALKEIANEFAQATDSDFEISSPEKLVEFYKQNGGIWDSDRVPTINVWTFFHQDDNQKKGVWYKKMVLETNSWGAESDFLYAPTRPFAGNLSQLLHIQFGDGANVAPFRYHSVRSLGFLLYAVCHLQNRLRCRFMDAIFEATLMYFRNVNDGDRSRLEKVDLTHMGLIPQGLDMVTQADRWQVNENLVVAGLSQNRQLMSENASSFVQDVDNGTAKELTATEVMARLNSANALVSSLLSMAYTYEEFKHQEICRRFTIRNSTDPDVARFQADCIKEGVPPEYLNSQFWDVEPERVMGGGNKTLEIAQAKSLMEVKGQYDPPAQREILRTFTLAITDDADMAYRLVPDNAKKETPAAHDAELALGALMSGGKVAVQQSIDHISYVEALLSSMLGIVEDMKFLAQQGELPTGQQVVGLTNASRHAMGHIKIIAQDENEAGRVREYQDVLGKIMNQVKLFSDQIDKQREQNADNADRMEQAIKMAESKAKIATNEAMAKQKLRHKELGFRADQQRKNVQTALDVQSERVKTAVDVQSTRAKTAADIAALDAKTAATVRAKKAVAAATPAKKETK